MPEKFQKWQYKDVVGFLKAHDFRFFKELDDSQEAWIRFGDNGPDRIVEVAFRRGNYSAKVIERMIKQSGLSNEDWRMWAAH